LYPPSFPKLGCRYSGAEEYLKTQRGFTWVGWWGARFQRLLVSHFGRVAFTEHQISGTACLAGPGGQGVRWDCGSVRQLLMASFSSTWRLYFLRRLLWQRTASAHRWAVLRQYHGSTALGGVELLGSGSHWVVRRFRLPTAQQLPGLVLLSSALGSLRPILT
jgi:hypothetical protein